MFILIEQGLTSHQTYYKSYWGWDWVCAVFLFV